MLVSSCSRSVCCCDSPSMFGVPNMSGLSDNFSVMSHKFMEGLNNVGIMGETVSLHNME